jgi:hypothetical protein
MHRLVRPWLAVGLLAWTIGLLPLPAGAWGTMGHEIVADLAARELSEPAREQVRQLLGVSMARVASWADDIRKQRPRTGPWHYVNLPVAAAGYDATRDCAAGDCVVGALERQLEILRDPRRSRTARSEALRFVIHLVADLHQPLHCGHGRDRGGNDISVRWFRRARNLHQVWDADILAQARLSQPQHVARLRAELRAEDREVLRAGRIADWVNEAHRAAVEVAYALPEDRRLGEAYYQRAAPVVDRQLARAGLRLARLLDEALAQPPLSGGKSIQLFVGSGRRTLYE